MLRMLAHGMKRPRFLAGMGALSLILFAAAAAPGCRNVPLLAPSGTELTLLASDNTLPVDGATEITAVLIEGTLSAGTGGSTSAAVGGGAPVHNGTVVTFTTTLGRLEPAEAKTSNGRATVRLVGDGRSGTAKITAYSGSATESIDVLVGAGAADHIAVTASPQALPGTGGSSVISARVEDEQGNSLSGVPVSFSTSAGSLSETRAQSNSQGVALTTLTTTQAAKVTATAGSATGTVDITIKPRTSVSIGLPASAQVAVPATVTITPATNAILRTVLVDFGDGTSFTAQNVAAAVTIPHAFRFMGPTTVTARATDTEGNVEVSTGQLTVAPLGLFLTASPTSPQRGDAVVLTAKVTDGAVVERYDWNLGEGSTPSTTTNQFTKIYSVTGTYVVTVTAIPLGGGTPTTQQISFFVRP